MDVNGTDIETVARRLQELHRTAAEGLRAAVTRTENIRWTAVLATVEQLEDDLARA